MRAIGRSSLRLAALVIIVLTALAAFVPRPGYADDAVKLTVKVTDAGFEPATVTVSQGQLVELTFEFAQTAYPDDEHVFTIDGYKLTTDKIDKNHKTATVKFIATKVGVFPFSCDIECAIHEPLQTGQLKVTAGGGAGAALTPTKLQIDPVANIAVRGDRVIVTATLKAVDGEPIPKADVTFLIEQQFVGTAGLMEVGTAKTGAAGVAQLVYRPRETDPKKMVVRFSGQGIYDATEAAIQLPGNQVFGPPPKTAGSDILDLKRGAKFGLIIVIVAIWGTFAFILYRAWSLRTNQPGGGA